MEIKTRRYFKQHTIEILEKGLRIDKKSLFEASEYEIPFDRLDNKRKVQTTMNNNLLITGIFFFVFGLLFLAGPNFELTGIFTFIALAFIIISFSTRKKVVTIASFDGNNVELYFNKQNKNEVIEFADQIIQAENVYFLNAYSKIDRDLPMEPQLEGIQFLRNRAIISEEHYETLKSQLLGRSNKPSIGFGS